MRPFLSVILVACGVLGAPSVCMAGPCICFGDLPRTLVQDSRRSGAIVVGTFTNSRETPAGVLTDLNIQSVIKSHDLLQGITKLTIARRVEQPKVTFVVFFEISNGGLEPIRAETADDGGDLIRYLDGALKLKGRPAPERLAYCFAFLGSKDEAVARDVLLEFANADLQDWRSFARKVDPVTLTGLLSNSKTPPSQFGLLATLLGFSAATPEHADVLKRLLEDWDRHKGSGIASMLAAGVMIEPKRGRELLQASVLPKADNSWLTRYAGLQAFRFLAEHGSSVIGKDDVVRSLLKVADQSDLADFVIDDLRKWQRWECTGDILDLSKRKTHDAGVIQRAALRFMLQSPAAMAKEFVDEATKRDPETVRDTREILKLESDVSAQATNGK